MSIEYQSLAGKKTILHGESDPITLLDGMMFPVELSIIIIDYERLSLDLIEINNSDRVALEHKIKLSELMHLSIYLRTFDVVIVNRIDMAQCKPNTKKSRGALIASAMNHATSGTLIVTTCTSENALDSRANKILYTKK